MPNLIVDDLAGLAALTATPAAITTTETVALKALLPIGDLQVGTTIRARAFGTISATTAGTVLARLRAGTAGTIADAQVCATPAVGSATAAVGWVLNGLFTVRSLGVGGSLLGNLQLQVATAVGVSAQTATVAVNTTVANFASITLIGGGTAPSITVVNALLEVAKP